MNITFEQLGVAPLFIGRLLERSFTKPTAIQERVIPVLLSRRDCLFQSATGTGKTFAYLIPLLQNLLEDLLEQTDPKRHGPQLVVCGPTYELCAQIKKETDFLLEGSPLKAVLLMGGANISRQIEILKKNKPHIIIGNIGRIIQLEQMGKLSLQQIRQVVLDEADRLVADDLKEETNRFVSLLPQERLLAACSATIGEKARQRLLPILRENYINITVENHEVLQKNIEHWALYAESRKKIGTLRSLLVATNPKKVLVFYNINGQIGNVVSQLQFHKIAALGLFGEMDKQARKKAIDDFRSGRVRVLITSDLAARGLDIQDISQVIALDVPDSTDAYAHRAGRTGRAGKHGIMITIGDAIELERLAKLEKKLGIVVYPKILYKGQILTPSPIEEQ
ncbi:DEAD/DEAH box helicase domain protein [Gracilinema caldarium DSM 7334]|uniref:DEAD/DEAH box helicase domain protein n=2 Tax=Gracilinema caldarium TaxID=215591 RepID=F8F1S0_GRAC1|nr:DEAD/DEAH box helicase domain protein [Gracilinema caldarium DSM 7334]